MAIQHRPSSRSASLTPALTLLGVGFGIGVVAGLLFIFLGADHVFPPAKSGDPVTVCRENLVELTNDVWLGYNQGRRADSLDDLRAAGTAPEVFRCPAAGGEHGSAPRGLATDYIYAPGLGEGDAIEPPLLFELPSNHGQAFFHVMPRDTTRPPIEIRDISLIHGHVQRLNEYLVSLRQTGQPNPPEGP